jgi:hypothetical protein
MKEIDVDGGRAAPSPKWETTVFGNAFETVDTLADVEALDASVLAVTTTTALAGTFSMVHSSSTTTQVSVAPFTWTLSFDTVVIGAAEAATGLTAIVTVPEVERFAARVKGGVLGTGGATTVTGAAAATTGTFDVVKERTLPDWFTETEFEAKTT